jgi:hypothetical protein
MPRFGSDPRGSSQFQSVQAQRQAYIDLLQTARNKQTEEFIRAIGRQVRLDVVFVPWIVSIPVVDMRFADVEGLARLDDVVSLTLNVGELEFHQGVDDDSDNDILDVRQAMRTDPYDNLGNNWRHIGVIDSGKRITHNMSLTTLTPGLGTALREASRAGEPGHFLMARLGAITLTTIFPTSVTTEPRSSV